MSEENKEVVKKAYAAFAAGDIETVLSLFDDNIEWVEPGQSSVSGTYHGRGEVGQLLAKFFEKSITGEPTGYVAEGDMVVGLTEASADDSPVHDANVFKLRDGKVVRVLSFADTAMWERVFGKK